MLSVRTLLSAFTVAVVSLAAFSRAEEEPSPPPATAPAAMPGLKVGDTAPDAQVALPSGTPVQLAEVYAKGPVVLVFYRGGWCPYCNKQLAGWDEQLSKVASFGAIVMAITPEGPEFIKKTTVDQKLRYGILSDYKNEAAEAFGIGFEMPPELQEKYKGYGVDLAAHNWDKSWKLPHPAVYVVDREAKVRYAYCNEDYKVRADINEVLGVLKQMAEERNAALKKKP
ncbi:MAG: AhpC/TSA family protein [Phycisphaerae bacterium]|nr:AhpC/TSA family protein [Phycisphaerae bacterium]